jgi:hypothetical protein
MIFAAAGLRKHSGIFSVLFLAGMLLISGCKQKMPSVPSDIIQMDKMQEVLIDIHIADAVAETRSMGDVNVLSEMSKREAKIK